MPDIQVIWGIITGTGIAIILWYNFMGGSQFLDQLKERMENVCQA